MSTRTIRKLKAELEAARDAELKALQRIAELVRELLGLEAEAKAWSLRQVAGEDQPNYVRPLQEEEEKS